MNRANRNKPPVPWLLIGVSILFLGVMTILGVFYHRNQLEHLYSKTYDELITIAQLKAVQVEQWRKDRIKYAVTITENQALMDQILGYLDDNDPGDEAGILKYLSSIVNNNDFRNVQIIDKSGRVRVAYPGTDTGYGIFLSEVIKKQLSDRAIFLSDFHENEYVDFIHLDLVVPVWSSNAGGLSAEAVIVFRIDPQKILYPFLHSWPVPSRSSESLLVRQEGDSVIYLNDVRYIPNSSLKLKLPILYPKLIAAKAVAGYEGPMLGADYRGVEVFAAISKVSDTPWYVIAKTDKSEVDDNYRGQINLNKSILILFIFSILSVIASIAWNRRTRFYRLKYENEVEKQALRKHFGYILKYANDIVLLADKDLNIVEANDRASEVYQYSRDELVGMKITQLRSPGNEHQLLEELSKLKQSGSTTFETVHLRKDGTSLPVEISARLFEIDGVSYFQSIGRDITERKKSENLLHERDFWLTESQKVGKIGSYVFDIRTNRWSSSEVLDDIFGIDKDFEKTLESWNMIVHPGYMDEMINYVRDHVIIGRKPFDKEYKVINQRSRKELWVYGKGELRQDSSGAAVLLIGTIQDITEQKNSEIKLRATEQTFTGLFDTVSDAIYIHRTDGVFMDVNLGAVRMYGYSRRELIGMTPVMVGAPGRNDLDRLAEILNGVFETGKMQTFEFWGRRKNGEEFPKEVVTTKGRYFGEDVLISAARDITERKRAADEVIRARDKAEENDRLKTAFLHNISHEIRTPMNAIVGFTALLDEPGLDEETRKHFTNIIYQSTNQLLGIITDIVDISNIETNQVKLNYSEVNVNSVIRDLHEQFLLMAQQKKLIFRFETKLPDGDTVITTDRTKLVQIISNLLNNAFKFTVQGTVHFGYSCRPGIFEFFVRDTGIGVPEEYHTKIFERFFQVESNSARQYGGAGLGLSICKAYAEILGGKIWIESKPGKGSSFYFTIPVQG